ncbi:hypothetical protein OAA09_00190 [bacterium]|nr:hypothetical protein [bacterium]
MFLILLFACSTEVGLLGYKEKTQDSAPLVDTQESDIDPVLDSGVEDSQSSTHNGITGYVNYRLRQVACPPCVGASQEIEIEFTGKFHQPTTDQHTSWIPEVGTCVDNLFTITPSIIPTAIGSNLSVSTSGHSFIAPQISTGVYQTSQIWESQYQRDKHYFVESDSGEFSILSSHGFDFIEPYTLLWVDPSYAYDTPIYRNGMTTFTWGPTSENALFMITVAIYSWDGSQFLGRVDCVENDFGYLSIPGSYFQGYPPGSLAAIHLNRHKIELVETSINNSFIETHTEWEVIGTGHIE